MKITTKLLLQSIVFSIVLGATLPACISPGCKREYNFVGYKPIYLSYEDLRASFSVEAARKMDKTGKIYYHPPYLFVNEINAGIHILDISNPAAPVVLGFMNIPGNVDIAMSGNTLYADSYIDLLSIDVSDINNITLLDRDEEVFPYRVDGNYSIPIDQTLGVVSGWVQYDTSVTESCEDYQHFYFQDDVVFFSAESSIASDGLSVNGSKGGSMARFTVSNNYLYCLSTYAMELFDVNVPGNPVYAGNVSMPWEIETIFPYNDYLFIGSTSGIYIYNNSAPFSPSFVSQFIHATSCDPVVVNGDYAYSTLRSGTTCDGFTNQLDIINISNISNPTLANTYPMFNPHGLGIDEDYLFICDGDAGLKMFELTSPTSTNLIQTVNIEKPLDVITADGLLIVVAENGYHLFDYTSGELVEVGAITK
jgi:hypothetical protein